jgi:hypothetical protein
MRFAEDNDNVIFRHDGGAGQVAQLIVATELKPIQSVNPSPDHTYTQCLKDAFDVLYEEGEEGMPKMMTTGLHCGIVYVASLSPLET